MLQWFKTLLCLAILASIVYFGSKFGTPYYKFYAFRSDSKEIANFLDVRNAEEVKLRIVRKAKELRVPIGENDITVEKTELGYKASAMWSEEVNILDKYKKKLEFSFEVGD
jgi:hypothetical protein